MESNVAVRKLCEYYAIPPYHQAMKQGDITLVNSLVEDFKMPLPDIEKHLKFDQVKNSYDNHMRRVGKELSNIVKQITR